MNNDNNNHKKKNLHTRKPKLRFLRITRCILESCQLLFLLFTSEMKNKEITMVDFNNKVLNV